MQLGGTSINCLNSTNLQLIPIYWALILYSITSGSGATVLKCYQLFIGYRDVQVQYLVELSQVGGL